jgi:hypothetical protein
MPLPPSEIARIQERISEQRKEIARKQARLPGVGPVQRAEIEREIEAHEGTLRSLEEELRIGEVGFG